MWVDMSGLVNGAKVIFGHVIGQVGMSVKLV